MSVYVDPLFKVAAEGVKNVQARKLTQKYGEWCHMIADTPEELYDMVARLGMRLAWGQKLGTPEAHFDLVPGRRQKAVRLGAKEISAVALIGIIQKKRDAEPIPVRAFPRGYGEYPTLKPKPPQPTIRPE